MAHKTLIGGTAYEIKKGFACIDGVSREIKQGVALIGGAAHKVAFAVPIKVNITGTGYSGTGSRFLASYVRIG